MKPDPQMETTTTPNPFEGVKPEMLDMFEEAQQKGLWFFCHYGRLWWSPYELAAKHREGQFRWSRKSFKLRDPVERLPEDIQ